MCCHPGTNACWHENQQPAFKEFLIDSGHSCKAGFDSQWTATVTHSAFWIHTICVNSLLLAICVEVSTSFFIYDTSISLLVWSHCEWLAGEAVLSSPYLNNTASSPALWSHLGVRHLCTAVTTFDFHSGWSTRQDEIVLSYNSSVLMNQADYSWYELGLFLISDLPWCFHSLLLDRWYFGVKLYSDLLVFQPCLLHPLAITWIRCFQPIWEHSVLT